MTTGTTEAMGNEFRDRMVAMYPKAYAAALDGTSEGARLARQWKLHFGEYAALSARYLALAKAVAKLRLEPGQVADRYEALDKAFDEHHERTKPLFEALERYKGGKP